MSDDNKDDLLKAHPVPTLPKLGFPDDRRETPTIAPSEVPLKNHLLANQYVQHSPKYSVQPPAVRQATVKEGVRQLTEPDPTKVVQGVTGSPGKTNISYALHDAPQKESPNSTKLHEDTHMMFNRVSKKYGKSGALRLATNLYNSIPAENRAAMRQFVENRAKQRYSNDEAATIGSHESASLMDAGKPQTAKKGGLDPRLWHEEHLSYLTTYLNDPQARQTFHSKIPGHTSPVTGELTDAGQAFHSKMKKAYRHLQQASRQADEGWTKRIRAPVEFSKLHKSMDWLPTKADEEAVMDMLHTFHDGLPEFEAARFMANQKVPTQEETDAALAEHEGDYESAALMAHGIEVNEANIRLIRKIMEMQELSKAEFEVALIPRTVVPFNNEAIPIANLIRDAYSMDEVKPVKLNGKHSIGTALVRDFSDDTLWLLKPGSGKISPARGANEETASQSRREVAFNQVAGVMGLGRYVPRSALLVLDDVEVAALEFFSEGFEPVERARKDKDRKLDEMFSKFVDNGLIYKWAAMDFLLGQPDRHAGNIMVDKGDNIRFIDAGSAFCGHSFSPASDPKSFIPFYLRVFTPRKFITMTPQERFNVMPALRAASDAALKSWVDSISEGHIVSILNQFNINPQPFVNRLAALRNYPGPKSEFLRKFYSNLIAGE